MGGSLKDPLGRALRRCSWTCSRGAMGTLPTLCAAAWLVIPAAALGADPAPTTAPAAVMAETPARAEAADTSGPAPSEPAPSGLRVDEMVFCAAIKDRQPAGVADTFPSDIYGVYCYTRVSGAVAPTSVSHVWYRGDARVAAKVLAVKASPWRTWSLKEMPEEWKGEWRVEVVSPDGAVLASRKLLMR